MKTFKIVASLILLLVVLYCCVNKSQSGKVHEYVGTDKCQSCHKQQFDLFKTSDHYHAMDTPSVATVKGDFNNSRFIYHGDTAFFYQRNNEYFVRTTDSTGVKKEFLVSYTFGWKPLQQYLVKFDDGRFQVLPFCWDTREKEKGGQRWFHLYDKERISHTDELFWMGINQNWNYMCADCHTTDFKKNFSLAENKFHSSWVENRVSCESCHGPASGHMQWAEKKDMNVMMKGFAISLVSKSINWQLDAAKQTLMPQQVMTSDTLIETCARCHARATRFTDEYTHGNSFLQSHIPATADPVNYHVDGQIKEEDYEYASFLQSKMHAAGVTCINCHEPHSMKVKAKGNALCTSCHLPAKYDGPQHSFHKPTSTGNQCVTCHMPITTYMVVDDRLDHSIRIPRPDHSLTMGTPNACNKCHTDKSVKWAADSFVKWYGSKLPKEKTYAELLYTVSKYIKESEPSLYDLLQNKNNPSLIRATAMENYGYYATSRVNELLLSELKSPDPVLRLNAIKALRNYPPENSIVHITPLLFDKIAAVRMEAMTELITQSGKLSEKDRKQIDKVFSEYMNIQEQMSHRPEGYFNRAILLGAKGETNLAEGLYKDCIRLFPDFVQAYSNLADLYRQQGREDKVKEVTDMGLRRVPKSAHLHYSAGLWYIRQKDNVKAMTELKLAAQYAPADAQLQYGYAIGLFSTGEQLKALQVLESFAAKYGNQPLILDGLISMSQDMKQTEKLAKYSTIRKEVFGY